MALKISNMSEIAIRLENMAQRASEGARFAMARGGEKIKDRAKDYAPVDEENLADSIVVSPKREGIRGRMVFDVMVDETHAGTRAAKVGQYATVMHESDYQLGRLSQIKQTFITTGRVGSKFLTRAMEDFEDEILKDVQENINKRVGK